MGRGAEHPDDGIDYIVVASTVTHHWPDVCLIRAVPHRVFQVVGMLLLAIGVPLLVLSLIALNRKYNRDQLATGGIYGIVRNPIYCAWVVFLIPGLVLLSPSWPLLLTPSVAYIAFRARIWQEEAYLEERLATPTARTGPRSPSCCPSPAPGSGRARETMENRKRSGLNGTKLTSQGSVTRGILDRRTLLSVGFYPLSLRNSVSSDRAARPPGLRFLDRLTRKSPIAPPLRPESRLAGDAPAEAAPRAPGGAAAVRRDEVRAAAVPDALGRQPDQGTW